MDEDRIILFDVDGNIQNELVDSQIRKFRGLSYVKIQNKINLVTTEKTRHAVKLVFLHLENLNNGVLRKMDLSKGGVISKGIFRHCRLIDFRKILLAKLIKN